MDQAQSNGQRAAATAEGAGGEAQLRAGQVSLRTYESWPDITEMPRSFETSHFISNQSQIGMGTGANAI